MDRDFCPIQEFFEVLKKSCPNGNVVFFVDEAHVTGVLGSKGTGLIIALGTQNEIAIWLHTYGKAMASTGGKILPIAHALLLT